MATAPPPGAGRRAAAEAADDEAAQQILTITIRREITIGKGEKRRTLPQSHTLAINLLSMTDKLAVRKATGLPFESFLGEGVFGEDSLVVVWWLARRKNGEAVLSFHEAAEQWPAELTAEDIDVHVGDPSDDADDPEA